MKKRILALLLCAITVFSLVSCSGSGNSLEQVADQKTRSNNPPITLCLYVPSVSKLTKEARESVEEALNAISIKKYNTTIKFFAYPEEEYIPIVLSKVKSSMDSFVSYIEKHDEVERGETNVDYPENVKATYNVGKYTELEGAGIDIFVTFETNAEKSPAIFDEEGEYYNAYAATNMFQMLYEQRALAALSPLMKGNYAGLAGKSYPEFREEYTRADINANLSSGIDPEQYAYAMPNNYVLGNYTYLIMNKAALAKAGFTQDYNLLSPVTQGNKADKKYTTLKNTMQMLGAEALGVDELFGSFESYEDYRKASQATEKGYAIAEVKGDIALPDIFENPDYAVIEYATPTFSNTECRQAAYCITRAYSGELENQGITEEERILRCLDILLLIQSDDDFRNTLQYGVKGEHYTIGRDGTVSISTSDYIMDPVRTGNMFLLLPSDRMSESMRKLAENNWALAKIQNNRVLDTRPKN